jgi:hypothetical protein
MAFWAGGTSKTVGVALLLLGIGLGVGGSIYLRASRPARDGAWFRLKLNRLNSQFPQSIRSVVEPSYGTIRGVKIGHRRPFFVAWTGFVTVNKAGARRTVSSAVVRIYSTRCAADFSFQFFAVFFFVSDTLPQRRCLRSAASLHNLKLCEVNSHLSSGETAIFMCWPLA